MRFKGSKLIIKEIHRNSIGYSILLRYLTAPRQDLRYSEHLGLPTAAIASYLGDLGTVVIGGPITSYNYLGNTTRS
jgi:hypothetical protein